ncbi:SDR family NAD(P)-dependent oxidoreductase [Actinacidiphila acididurans]|uniref:SDR family oxidoreductase n=1 Tax=Actinacidiphila acididurans TaxID=2784346 RepID=A0ABS2TJ32_9ACTN|nr:SDR family oxidoreductase [Actinacidiphila acididurans]MBM9503067.1 SDR family oxidoreductase [Actinacidiphila acididurans]
MPSTATYDFTGQVVLVTGGSSGIGLQVARDFVDAGAHVVIAGRTASRLEAAREQLGAGVTAVTTDVGDAAGVNALVDGVIRDRGHLDVVISNAASFIPGDVTAVEPADWDQSVRTNLNGFFYLAKAVLPHLAASGGSFIATSSVSGMRADWGMPVYNAAKGAVSLFVQALALDWGAKGVRVNAVAPSLTSTEPVAAITGNPALRSQAEARVALGRIAETGDISPVVLFLASDAARYVNGVILPVDGGTSASNGQARWAAA